MLVLKLNTSFLLALSHCHWSFLLSVGNGSQVVCGVLISDPKSSTRSIAFVSALWGGRETCVRAFRLILRPLTPISCPPSWSTGPSNAAANCARASRRSKIGGDSLRSCFRGWLELRPLCAPGSTPPPWLTWGHRCRRRCVRRRPSRLRCKNTPSSRLRWTRGIRNMKM